MSREAKMRGYAAALPHIRAAIKAYREAAHPRAALTPSADDDKEGSDATR
jgi:hypothetical protein